MLSSSKQKKKVNILLVEDNPGDVRLTQEVFKESSFEVSIDVCLDGEEALAFLEQRLELQMNNEEVLPDIVILDLNLPKKNGLELLKDIKYNPDLSHLPVLVLTSSGAQNDVQAVYEAGVNCYLIKPVDYQEFCELIKSIETFWFDIATLPVAENKYKYGK